MQSALCCRQSFNFRKLPTDTKSRCCHRARSSHCLVFGSDTPPGTVQRSVKTSRTFIQQASTSYKVVFTSEQPYYVRPGQTMLQKMTIVKVNYAPLDIMCLHAGVHHADGMM